MSGDVQGAFNRRDSFSRRDDVLCFFADGRRSARGTSWNDRGRSLCGAGAGLVSAEHHRLLPPQNLILQPDTYWGAISFYVGLVIFLMRLTTQSTQRAYQSAKSELAHRKRAEQHLGIALEAGEIGIWEGDLNA